MSADRLEIGDGLSRENAEKIRAWVDKMTEGWIEYEESTGAEIHDVCFILTGELRKWLNYGAHILFRDGMICISNWPEKKEEFEARELLKEVEHLLILEDKAEKEEFD